MTDEKKPAGPVVIRKGHVKPPPPGTPLEVPVVESLDAAPARTEKPDGRPLWQRLADQKKAELGGAAPAPASPEAALPSGAPAAPPAAPAREGAGGVQPRFQGARGPGGGRGGPPGRGPGGPGGERRGPRGERDKPRFPKFDHDAGQPGQSSAPGLPAGEPPPAPEAAVADEGSFADLLAGAAGASQKRRRFQAGEKVAGKIIQIGQETTFLDLGSGLADGMIETIELQDAEGTVTSRVGDILDAVVVKGGDRGVQVSIGRASATSRDHAREAVIEAAHTGLPVEGLVKAVNKGGLEVEVQGVRAFCPMSHIDVRFVGDATTLIGQKLQFRVTKADDRDVVLSRRVLLEAERAEKAALTRQRLQAGAVFEGTVTSVQDYGAFVDLGGVEGLVHVSELAWDRVSKPQDLLKSGDAVTVTVLRIDEDPKKGERIALSVKALTPRPEPKPVAPGAERPARPAPPPPPKAGDVVEAAVDKIESFGLFVKFAGGRGLVPASETGTPHGTDLRRAFKAGDAFPALVLQIDEQGRFRLSKTGAVDAAERADARAYMETQKPKGGGKGFGTLGDLLKAKLGKS
ncbi:MAG: S1 RNA-binding domain-containing protein [Anaeromyxobacter sp.]|nr:S1 RNA-binding domain-containing protein [Anaeromyxobacter sp.]MBL0275733.1 S1 RNA-binding domain-containing protein [Anaeromyxobacter sp.]